MADEVRWSPGNHPTPGELLLAGEDQLPREEAEPIRAHAQQCWECRAQIERYKRGIDAYVEFRKADLDPAVAPEPQAWLRMSARLRETDRQPPERSGGIHWHTRWYAMAAVAASAVIGALMFWPKPLTAEMVLDRAMRAEADSKPLSAQHVVVRREGRRVPADPRALAAAHIDTARPLSARTFREWRDGLHHRRDQVTETGRSISLETSTVEGAVSTARLTVAERDYQPLSKHVELRDGTTIDVDAVATPEVSSSAGAAPAAPVEPDAGGPAKPELSAGERDAIELEVRWALHRADADLGEPLDIRAAADGLVVSGTLDDTERRDRIVEALSRVAHVTTDLKIAPMDADILGKAQPIHPDDTSRPLLAVRIEKDLPDAEARRNFITGGLRLSQDILRHAWALRRLAARYPGAVEGRLEPAARASLEQLASAHEETIRMAAREAAEHWKPYLDLAAAPGGARRSWQAASQLLLANAQSFDHATVRLLAAGANDGLTAGDALRQAGESYRQILSNLGAENQ